MNQTVSLASLKRRRPSQTFAINTLQRRILRAAVNLPSFFRDGNVGLSVEKELRHRQPDKEANANKNKEAGRSLLVDEVGRCLALPKKEPLLVEEEPRLTPFPTSSSFTAGLARHRRGRRLSLGAREWENQNQKKIGEKKTNESGDACV